MGGSREYFDQVAHRVEALIPDDNEYLGAVSYTHLDVYKRQVLHCGAGSTFAL